jgi:hypothetical protein
MTETVTDGARTRLARVAEVLIPAGHGLPSAVEAGVHTNLLDEVVKARPDLVSPLLRALDALDALGDDTDLAAVERLAVREPDLHHTLTLVVAGAYLMSRRVGALLKYPFQEAKLVDPRDIALVVSEGLLDPVVERGHTYRLPPDAPAGLDA